MLSVDQIIREHPLFLGMSKEQLGRIVQCAQLKHCEAGEYILRTVEGADWFYLIGPGQVSLELHIPEQGKTKIECFGEGDVLGWLWLFPPYDWSYDARALEPTCTVRIDGRKLRAQCAVDQQLGCELVRRVAPLVARLLENAFLQNSEQQYSPKRHEHGNAPKAFVASD